MRLTFRLSSFVRLAALAAVIISCTDSPTAPVGEAPVGSMKLSDSVYTRGAVIRAGLGAPAGYTVVPGTATWTVVSGGASLTDLGGGDDSVSVALSGTGAVQLRATYTLRREGVGSNLTIGAPTRRPGGDVVVEVSKTIVVAAPVIDYTVNPTASVTAGQTLGGIQVAIKDARGQIITTATDSIVIAVDPTSGGTGATLLGTLRVRPTAGVASFPGLSIQKAGVNYRLIASSPTLAARDTATTTIVAGAATAAQSTFAVADTIVTVAGTTTVTVTLRDQYGNPVLTATPALFVPSASEGTLGAFSCANGVCTATYTAANTPGTPTLNATLGGTAIGGAPKTITVRPGAPTALRITGDSTQAAGTTKNLTITALDALGNVATSYTGAKSLTFSGAANAATGTVPTIGGANVGTATSVTFTNGVATPVASILYKVETAVLATTDGTISAAGANRQSVRVFAAAPNAAQTTLAVSDSVRAVGQTATVTVTVKDAFGNPVLDATGASFAAAASAGTLGAFSCASGVCTATYTAPATVATHTISATIGGTAVTGSPKTVRVPDTTPPAITGPSGAAGAATSAKTIDENTTAVHTLAADEPATWTLSGADAARFTITAGGALSFIAAPDFENPNDLGATAGNNTYVVTVTATDAAGNFSTQTITVTVADVDDTPPVLTGPSGAAGDATSAKTINENTTAVHTFTANEAVTWTLSGDDAARFTIVGGALAFAAAPDFELPNDLGAGANNNTYVVVVTGTDAAGNFSTQTVTVTVADVDDTPPVLTGPSGVAGATTGVKTINENTTAVDGFTANEAVTWTLSGADAARFSITAGGALSFTAAPDFETPLDAGDTAGNNTYVVIVTGTDAAGNASSQTITVTVADVDDTAPEISGPSGAAGAATSAVSIAENTTAVFSFGTNEAGTWSIDGTDAGLFAIDAAGNLTFIAAPDFETPLDNGDTAGNNTYVVDVEITDAAGNIAIQTVTVTVTDIDDTPPGIQGPAGGRGATTSESSFPEGTTTVHTFTTDELLPVTWSIVPGADGAKFTLSAAGVLTFNTAPDFENPTDGAAGDGIPLNNIYVVRVRAVDAAGNASEQIQIITITNVADETAPVITGPSGGAGSATSAKTVDENTTAVHTLTANEAVTWTIGGGADAAKFAVDAAGNLTFVSAPDFENPNDLGAGANNNTYVVIVRATDAAGNISNQTVTVTVANVDDTAPLIAGPTGAAGAAASAKSIPENSTAVHTFLANEGVTWTIDGGEDAARFTITAGGALAFAVAPDFETPLDLGDTAGNNTYVVVIKATDLSPAANTASQTVTVTVTDLDDSAPVITGPSGAAGDATSAKSIVENTTAVHTFTSSEPAGWSISGGADAAAFTIDPATGALRFIAAPDFEAPTDLGAGAGNNTYVVEVRATDLTGNFTTQTVTVTVTNGDDAAPVITGPTGGAGAATSTKSIVENTTAVHGFTSSEPVTWTLTGADVSKFQIDASGNLSFILAPDFESPTDAGDTPGNNTYVVGVVATDAAGNISTQTVTVTVTDIDDVAPVITGPSGGAGSPTSAKSIAENTTAVATFTSSEPATWTLSGPDAAKFSIDAAGNLTFNAAPNFEAPTDLGATAGNNTYVVTVRATDGATLFSSQVVTITVTDVDENAPVITGPSGAAGAATSAKSIVENTTAVATFSANEAVTWSIDGGDDAAKFSINAAGELVFNAAPDFESPNDIGAGANNNTYVVIIKATDGVTLTATQTVTVTVTNADDTAPVITGPSGAAGDATSTKTINENTTAVHTMTASEAVTWSITGGADAARFTITAGGALRFVAAPDFEAPIDLGDTGGNNTYVVTVTATDAAGNTSAQTVTVTVANVDDAAPDITGPTGAAGAATSTKSIAENSTAVHTFTASEAVTWTLSGDDAAKFTITAGGALAFASAPDFETPTDAGDTAGNNTYVVEVKATDAAGNVSIQTVTVTVTNVDDTAPVITGPTGAAGDATSIDSLPENTTAVHTLTANEAVTWSITGGDDAAKFAITAGGALSFIAAPDFETPTDVGAGATNNTYVVIVTATDASTNASSQTITITVTDVDDSAPIITGPSGAAGAATSAKSIPENGTAVHTFTANETATWSVTGGADQAKFSINATTGALSFVTAPDFETPTDLGDTAGNNTYVVIITATDTLGLPSTQTVTVTVTDLDDTAPVIQGPSGGPGAISASKSIVENTTAVNTMTADEPVTWSLVAGSDGAKFTIDPTTGALSFIAAPDFEAPTDIVAGDGFAGNNIYVVVVKATDAAGNTSTQTVTVTVTNIVDEVAPIITGPSGGAGAATSSASVPENTTAVHTFTASEAVNWTLSGADAAKFTITAGGALAFAVAPDFETPTDVGAGAGNNTYVVTVTATDAGGNVVTQTVTITVTNAPELVLAGSAQPSVAVGEVTERVVFTVQSGAVRTAVTGATTFNLTASGGGTFYSDVNGTTPITSATVPAAADSFVVYYSQAAGAGTTTTLTATRSAGDAVAAASVNLNVTAAASAASRLTGIVCSATTGNSNSADLSPTIDPVDNPCTATAGQLLVMIMSHSPTANPYDMPTFATPAGWTLLRQESVGTAATPRQLRTYVYYRVAASTGDVSVTFSTGTGGSAPKVRSTYIIAAINNPNGTPIDVDAVASTMTPTAGITTPSANATSNGSMLLSYTVQDIGSNAYTAPAGLATVGQAGNGGQAVTMIIFSKDRFFAGATPTYTTGTAQIDAASTAGVVIIKPQ